MLQSKPFKVPLDQSPGDMAGQLMRYSAASPSDTVQAKVTLAGLKDALGIKHPGAALTQEDIIKISKGEMQLPDHIRAAGSIKYRSGDMVRERAERLETLIGTADAHTEALDEGLRSARPTFPTS